jgi:hypothetical protein
MQRAISIALLTAIRNLGLCYYTSLLLLQEEKEVYVQDTSTAVNSRQKLGMGKIYMCRVRSEKSFVRVYLWQRLLTI